MDEWELEVISQVGVSKKDEENSVLAGKPLKACGLLVSIGY